VEEELTSIPFVQRVKTAKGIKLYFRRGGFRRALSSPDNSEALRNEVAKLLGEVDRIKQAKTPLVGTLGGALHAYNHSTDFLGLARSTQSGYQRRIDEIIEDAGDILLMDIDMAFVNGMKQAWARRGHRLANITLQILKNALRPAIIDGRISTDPFVHIKKVKRPHGTPEKNPIWEDHEVQAVIELALARKMPGLARAVALGRWGGFRRGTICRLPVEARVAGHSVEGKAQHRLYWLTEKRRVQCDKPEDDRLTALLDATPNRAAALAYNQRGERFQERALNQAIDRLIERLSKAGKVRPILTLHGLRHTRGVELAIAGASDSEIMSQLEHTSTRAAEIYRRQANRRNLADSAQSKIDTVRARREAQQTAKSSHEPAV
jgi:site-specific recombinase XerD